MPHWPGYSGWSRLDIWPKPSQTESFPGTFNVALGEKTPLEVVNTGASSGPTEACREAVPREWDFWGLGTLFLLWKWSSPTLIHKIFHQVYYSCPDAFFLLCQFWVFFILVCTHLLSYVQLFVTPWPVEHQAPLSVGCSRQGYWNGLPFPSPGDLPDPGIAPMSPQLAGGFFTIEPPGKPCFTLKLS